MPGNDINECRTKTSSPEVCMLLCEETKGCVQFTWFDKNSVGEMGPQSCCLKNVLNTKPKVKEGAITGSMKKCGKTMLYP